MEKEKYALAFFLLRFLSPWRAGPAGQLFRIHFFSSSISCPAGGMLSRLESLLPLFRFLCCLLFHTLFSYLLALWAAQSAKDKEKKR